MRNLIITINASTRKIETNKNFLGINGENLNGDLIVEFKDEFIDGFAYLEIFDGSQKYLLSMEKVEDHYVLPILSSLLATVGDLQCQIRVNSQFDANSVSIFKSEKFKLPVLEAINATETMPEQYPTWIEEADLKILNIQNNLNAEITAREQADANLQANKQDKLTQPQLDAVNSGIDSTKVAQIGTNTTNITNLTGRVGTAETNITNLQNNKVDKTSTVSQIYGTNSNGEQATYTHSTSGGAWTIPQRNADGNVQVALNPTDDYSATSKLYADKYNMCPSDDNSLTVTATPVAGNIYFTAPANGMAYLRFNVSWNGQNSLGTIDFNIVGTNNNYLMYFSQEYYDTNAHVYMVNIPLKKGQRIRCNSLANININWGGMTFIKSEEQ